MKFGRFVATLLVVVLALLLAIAPAGAQDEELDVLILPVNQAQFLPGAMFDFRVEVEAAALPENFAITVNGTPAAEFFGAEAIEEAWEYGGRVSSFVAEGTPGADFTVDALAGEYYNAAFGPVTVVAADGALSATVAGEEVVLEATEDPLAFTVVGGAADGMTLTFGLDAEGAVTGFQVAGQDFGVLTTLPTKVASVVWRGLTAPEAGEYVVEVVAGGTTETVTWTVRTPQAGEAKNVVLFIADGMTVPMITAARAARGMDQGRPTNPMAMDGMEYRGLASTSSIDSLMADSANTASSINTGHISSVNATGSYADTSPNSLDDPQVETFGEMIKRTRGMSVGVVTTSDISDATPAAVWAAGRNRGDGNRANYLLQAVAFQPEVFLGGGARRFLPQGVEGSRRSDDVDVFGEFEGAGYTIVTTGTELSEAVSGDALPERLVGIFHPSDLNVWLDRNVYTSNVGDLTDQPGLVDMTLAALTVLNQNPNGFYLAIEAASVDKQFHPLDQERALSDLIEFDQAVEATIAWAQENAPDTLIVVTADHGHGYEVYGTVRVEQFNEGTTDAERRDAVRTYGGAGYPNYPDADGDGQPEWGDATITFAGTVNNGPDRTENFQVSEVPRVPAIRNDEGVYVDNPDDDPNGIFQAGNLRPGDSTGVHTLQDVPVFASGPGAEYFNGSYHQHEIFFGMAAAIGLDPSAADGMSAAAQSSTVASGFGLSGEASGALLLLVGLVGGLFISRLRRQ